MNHIVACNTEDVLLDLILASILRTTGSIHDHLGNLSYVISSNPMCHRIYGNRRNPLICQLEFLVSYHVSNVLPIIPIIMTG